MLTAKMIDIVVRLDAAEHYTGGIGALREFLRACNGTYREDVHLAAVSWMGMADANWVVEALVSKGLRFDAAGADTDIAVFEMYGAIPHVKPTWLARGRSDKNSMLAYWLAGTEPGPLVDW